MNIKFYGKRLIIGCSLAVLSVSAFACADRSPTPAVSVTASELIRRADAAKSHPLSEAESRQLEEQLFNEFTKGVPQATREELRRGFESPIPPMYRPDGDRPRTKAMDVQIALFDAILKLREQRIARTNAPDGSQQFDSAGKVRVRVAIIRDSKDSTADAMIFRSATDGGIPTVVIEERRVNALSLQRAIASAVRSLSRDGAQVRETKWLAIHHHAEDATSPKTAAPAYDAAVREISGWPIKDLEGIGAARTFIVWSRAPTKLAPQ